MRSDDIDLGGGEYEKDVLWEGEERTTAMAVRDGGGRILCVPSKLFPDATYCREGKSINSLSRERTLFGRSAGKRGRSAIIVPKDASNFIKSQRNTLRKKPRRGGPPERGSPEQGGRCS